MNFLTADDGGWPTIPLLNEGATEIFYQGRPLDNNENYFSIQVIQWRTIAVPSLSFKWPTIVVDYYARRAIRFRCRSG